MRVMVIEQFRNRGAKAIYARLAERGRIMPEGLNYINSWIQDDFSTCWQVMETDDPEKQKTWIATWSDLMTFEVSPVLTSAEARKSVGAER